MTAIIEFEAVARLRSFTAASVELGVTQAAVSRQIRGLEDALGKKLFTRMHRSIKLTMEGEFLFREVSESLKRMSTACDRLTWGAGQEEIVLSTTSAFAHFRILPRLSILKQTSPQLRLRLTTEDYSSDFRKTEVDLAVRYGAGHWRDGTSTLLFDEEVFPVCAPPLLDAAATQTVDQLANIPLITYDAPVEGWISWDEWFAAVGIRPLKISHGLRCSFYTDAIRAALHGQGAVLGWKRLLHDLLQSGELVQVTREALRTTDAYFVVLPHGRQMTPALDAVIRWLRDDPVLIDQ